MRETGQRESEREGLNLTDSSQLSTFLLSPLTSLISQTHTNIQNQHSVPFFLPLLPKKPILSHSHQMCLSPPISSLSALQSESHSSSHTSTLPSPLGSYKYHCCYEYTVFFPQHPSLHQKPSLSLSLSSALVIPPFEMPFPLMTLSFVLTASLHDNIIVCMYAHMDFSCSCKCKWLNKARIQHTTSSFCFVE